MKKFFNDISWYAREFLDWLFEMIAIILGTICWLIYNGIIFFSDVFPSLFHSTHSFTLASWSQSQINYLYTSPCLRLFLGRETELRHSIRCAATRWNANIRVIHLPKQAVLNHTIPVM